MTAFADRLLTAMKRANLKQVDLSERTGIGKSLISQYLSGDFEPKQKNIYRLAQATGVTPGYLMGMEEPEEPAYYINPETAKLAQEIHDDPELRILMDASRDLEPEDIKAIIDLVKRMKKKERGDHVD